MSKSKAAKQVFEHFKRTCRPDSIQGLVNNLSDCKKAEITKAIEALVDDGRVIEKTSGKSKIYYLNQKEVKKGLTENASELEQGLLDKQEKLKSIENAIKEKEAGVNLYNGRKTKSECTEENKKLLKRLDEVQNELKKTEVKKSEKENKKKNYDFEQVSKECRKRKRITKEIVDQLEEYISKPKKKLLEDIGIEYYN